MRGITMSIPKLTERNHHFLPVILLAVYDLLAIAAAVSLALALRFDTWRFDYLMAHHGSLPFVLASYLFVYFCFNLYHYHWQYAGVETLWSIFFANVLGTALGTIWQLLLDGKTLPASIIILTCLLATGLVGAQRMLLRMASSYFARLRQQKEGQPWDEQPKRTVILGDGHCAVEVLVALDKDRGKRYEIIGILDDDPRYHGSILRGHRILGELEMLNDLLRRRAVDEVIIALPDTDSERMREFVLACCRHKVAVRVVPMIAKLLDNPSAARGRLRVQDISVEDLLHRAPLPSMPQDWGHYVTGARVLVTGAGGSIGSELCRQVCRMNPALLVLLGHGENSIHTIEQELKHTFPELAACIIPVICDIRDARRLNTIVAQHRPRILFHAAAHKHVPMMEENAVEAVTNNIGGTRNVIRAASAHHVERMVLISTDKAVQPSSIMGASKFFCEELLCAEASRSRTCFLAVRFGNVLGSRGSVLPTFQEQIMRGGPVTVTHKEMRRFFMTIPEAVSLVLQAGSSEQSGTLFVFDMGQPVRILDLAEDVIRLSGLEPYQDIRIEFCGLRSGEKLTEALFTASEEQVATRQGRLFVVHRPQYIAIDQLDSLIEDLLDIAGRSDERAVRARLLDLLPTLGTPAKTLANVP